MSTTEKDDKAKAPATAPKKNSSELTEKELGEVAGGFNPQPDPPGRQ